MTPQQIVADLRAQVVIHELTGNAGMQRVVTASAAADTIEAQQAEIERLRWWLSEIDARGKQYGPEELADLALEGLVGTPAQGVQP